MTPEILEILKKKEEYLNFYIFNFIKLKMLTGKKDQDLLILMKLDDRSIINFCIASGKNKYAVKLCSDEDFWRNRLNKNFPKLDLYNEYWKNQSFKEKYLKTIYYVDKLKREYNFDFQQGDPELSYKTLKLKQALYNKLINDNMDPYFYQKYQPVFDVFKEALKRKDLIIKSLFYSIYNDSDWDDYLGFMELDDFTLDPENHPQRDIFKYALDSGDSEFADKIIYDFYNLDRSDEYTQEVFSEILNEYINSKNNLTPDQIKAINTSINQFEKLIGPVPNINELRQKLF